MFKLQVKSLLKGVLVIPNIAVVFYFIIASLLIDSSFTRAIEGNVGKIAFFEADILVKSYKLNATQ